MAGRRMPRCRRSPYKRAAGEENFGPKHAILLEMTPKPITVRAPAPCRARGATMLAALVARCSAATAAARGRCRCFGRSRQHESTLFPAPKRSRRAGTSNAKTFTACSPSRRLAQRISAALRRGAAPYADASERLVGPRTHGSLPNLRCIMGSEDVTLHRILRKAF